MKGLFRGIGHVLGKISHTLGRKGQTQRREGLSIDYGEPLLQQVVDAVVERFGYKGALLALINQNENKLELKAHRIEPRRIVQAGNKLNPTKWRLETGEVSLEEERNIGVKSVKEKRVIITHDLHELFGPMIPEGFCKTLQNLSNVKAMVSVPFMVANTPLGNLYAASEQEHISDVELRILQSFSDIASVAVKHLMEVSAIRNQINEEQSTTSAEQVFREVVDGVMKGLFGDMISVAVVHLTQAITLQNLIGDVQSTLSANEIFQKVVDDVVENLGYKAAMLAQVDMAENKLKLKAWHIKPQRLVDIGNRLNPTKWRLETGEVSLDDDFNIGAIVLRKPNILCETTDSLHKLLGPMIPEWLCDMLQHRAGYKQFATIPFRIEGKPVGNLYVANEREFISESNIWALQAFAAQAAVAIQNAELYRLTEQQRRDAEKLAEFAEKQRRDAEGLAELAEQQRRESDKAVAMAFLAGRIVHRVNNELGKARLWSRDNPRVKEKIELVLDMVQKLKNDPFREATSGPVDVWANVEAALADVKLPDGITVEKQCAQDLPQVWASEQLTEVFRILIKNACEAMSETFLFSAELDRQSELEKSFLSDDFRKEFMNGGISLSENIDIKTEEEGSLWRISDEDKNQTCIVRRKDEALNIYGEIGTLRLAARAMNDKVQVSVADTGAGISPENVSKIFELDFTTKKEAGGLGFGLWWTRMALRWLNGDIQVESSPGQGSTFLVSLPAWTEANQKNFF